jgi:thiosulfate/3-mercaptopyruvate sulfurtransferase
VNSSYRNQFFIAIYFAALVLLPAANAQAPVLFDGTGPVVFDFQAAGSADSIPRSQLITPEDLAKSLTAATTPKPLLLGVGPRSLYAQAHIPGSEYMGAGSSDGGRKQLRHRVKGLPHNTAIVLYCGCCPWDHCPNVQPAYDELRVLGFSNVKVLFIANNFGTDWVDKGYPVAKGE